VSDWAALAAARSTHCNAGRDARLSKAAARLRFGEPRWNLAVSF